MLLWLAFFALGLVPDWFYDLFRTLGQVTTQDACVNNLHLIPPVLALYLSFFLYRFCVHAGQSRATASSKAIQAGLLAFIAFLPLRIDLAMEYLHVPIPFYRNLLLSMLCIKSGVWLYLLVLIVGGHLWPGKRLVQRMPLFLLPNHPGPPTEKPPERP